MDDVDASSRELARAAAETVARTSYGRLVALLAGRTRDIAGAEDALSEALAAALATWPDRGVPDNPEAWLLTAARRKRIDGARSRKSATAASAHLVLMIEELQTIARESIPDRRLALMFACAHPAIDPAVRAPLILQTVLGLDAAAIASAFLVKPASMGQRLVRAKQKIREAGIPFRIPEADEWPGRRDAVLEAIYAAYAEGWADPAGADARRRNLAEEAVWLGRVACELLPGDPEALGLLALMLHCEARREARRDAAGEFVPLHAQDTGRWNAALIEEAEAMLCRASRMHTPGRYQLEAAIQSAHAARRQTGRTDWPAIVQLYDALYALTGSPVVAINRATALSHAEDPAAGLAALEEIAHGTRLEQYQPYWAARADLMVRTGDIPAAHESFQRAIGLESDPAVRKFLQRRDTELKN